MKPDLGDLFAIFPDLPWRDLGVRPLAERLSGIKDQAAEARRRAAMTAIRQRASVEWARRLVRARAARPTRSRQGS